MSKDTITVCVDDGHPLDLKVAEILFKNKLPGIFYIPINNSEGKPTLKIREIFALSKYFEIGAHGLNHRVLTEVPNKVARREIVEGKLRLEEATGKKVRSFCPPRGKYNPSILKIVKDSGFEDVRSARLVNFQRSDRSKFLWHPNLHIYPHTLCLDLWDILKSVDPISLKQRLLYWNASHLDLLPQLRNTVKNVYIWLHSWEVEKYKMWKVLERL